MASWTVLEPPDTAPDTFAAAERSAFVKDGWCWPALFFAPVWLLWRRMWLVFLGWLVAIVAINAGGMLLKTPEALISGLELLFSLWFALEANALRRWTLLRRGWRLAGLASGAGRVDAELRFFEHANLQPPAPAVPQQAPSSQRHEAVLGVFPEPWGPPR